MMTPLTYSIETKWQNRRRRIKLTRKHQHFSPPLTTSKRISNSAQVRRKQDETTQVTITIERECNMQLKTQEAKYMHVKIK